MTFGQLLQLLLYLGVGVQAAMVTVVGTELAEALIWKKMYNSNAWYFASEQMDTWCYGGKLPYMRWSSRRRLLKIACSGWTSEQRIKRLALVAGPNGWAIFQMLLARHPIRRRLLNWRY